MENTTARELRARKHLSLERAAEQIGMPLSTLARLERPGANPHLRTAQKVARFYRVSVDKLWPLENGHDR